jgi:hypothetical protein
MNDRLAGELHDLVAHQASIVAIQANAAQRLLDADPDAALASLEAAHVAATATLQDLARLRRVLAEETAE